MRARSIRLHSKTVEKLMKLKREAERDGAHRVATRIHAVLMNHDGRTSGEISRILDRPRSRVADWLKSYEERGYESMLEGHRSGRPCSLEEKQKLALSDIIDSGPIAYGFLSGVWSSILIAEVIKNEFSISYHPGHVRKLLYELGFSVQRPKRILAKADPEKQNRWIRYTYPRIKKKLKKREQR